MNKKIIIWLLVILVIVAGTYLFLGSTVDEVPKLNDSREIAENWIINESPTFVFDGENLTFERDEILGEKKYKFVFSFESRAAGYGDRTDEVLAQVITPHTMEIVLEEGEVVSAITDEIFDEMQGKMLEDAEGTASVKLFFIQVVEGQEELVEVERTIPFAITIARATLEELLRGPLPQEEELGLTTAINKGTLLQNVNIENGVAVADFNEKLQEGIAGSAWVTAIRNQIEKTLLQFDTIDEVIISINGETEEVLQP